VINDPDPNTSSGPEPNGQGSAVEADPRPATGEDLGEVRRQRDEYYDQLLRARADFSNYQKRARAQAETDRSYAAGDLARDLLPVLDNFERAADAARAAGASSIVEGLDMVHKQLLAALAKHGVVPIAALGEPFDPNRHEALLQQPSPDHPEGTVVAELGKGYALRDRVLRPTKVAVSVKPNQ
jgi:molecular chaperone GrpE